MKVPWCDIIQSIGVIAAIIFSVHSIRISNIRERPFFAVSPQLEIQGNSLIFQFQNVGKVQAEDVKINTFSILEGQNAKDDYDQYIRENLRKLKEGRYYGIMPPDYPSNVAWDLELDPQSGKVTISTKEIFVLRIDYKYNNGSILKHHFAFYRHMEFHNKEAISLTRQIEMSGEKKKHDRVSCASR